MDDDRSVVGVDEPEFDHVGGAKGQGRARAARAARDEVIASVTSGLTVGEGQTLEALLDKLVAARVASRIEKRRSGESGPWWCRTCDFASCGRPTGNCPAQVTASQMFTQ